MDTLILIIATIVLVFGGFILGFITALIFQAKMMEAIKNDEN